LGNEGLRLVILLQNDTGHTLEHPDGIAAHREPILALVEEDPEEVVNNRVSEWFPREEFKEGQLYETQQDLANDMPLGFTALRVA